MPIVALCTCVFIGYVLKPRALVEEVELTGRFKKKKLFCVMIRYVAPVFLLMILASAVLSAFGVIAI